MKLTTQKSQRSSVNNETKRVYEVPAIIFEGAITTRAGSPTGSKDGGVDPADLFGID